MKIFLTLALALSFAVLFLTPLHQASADEQKMSDAEKEMMAKWPEVSKTVRTMLHGGGRVVVHCRGGCGRSGMVALRLMVECGEDRFSALTRLRGVRDCAVETKGQLHWAFAVEEAAATPVFTRHRSTEK